MKISPFAVDVGVQNCFFVHTTTTTTQRQMLLVNCSVCFDFIPC